MRLIKDLGLIYPNKNSNKKVRMGIYECPLCNKHFQTRTPDVKSGKSTKCLDCRKKIPTKTIHKMCRTPLYYVWCNIIDRTENKNNSKNYPYYGAKEISMCQEWRHNFLAFYEWALNSGYKKGLSIDRINSDGNYEPSNCRWATQSIQSRNTRVLRKTNTSGYRGVSFHKRQQKWNARITVNSITINLGSYLTPEEAGKAYNNFVIKNNLEHTINKTLENEG